MQTLTKPLTHLCRQIEANTLLHVQLRTHKHAHLEIDRLHLATRRILARIKSALQKSRKQKHSQRRRGEPLDSQDCHLQTERGSWREGEGGRGMSRGGRGRSCSGVLTGRCVRNACVHVCDVLCFNLIFLYAKVIYKCYSVTGIL